MATTPSTQPPLSVHVTIRVSPTNAPRFLELLRPCQEGCLSEPQCLYFDVFHDGHGLFRFVEVWTLTRAEFESVQMRKPYYEPYLSLTTPMWTQDRDIQYFEQVPGWLGVRGAYFEGRVRT
ncbi:uncharacterized protein HMPREF1541_01340 [Cyphellophora europaea CBS 101466]|uniref:ABM domain-containing protein n=1 Tax=Cyphellophora europaea (strain CBS 101466) TaxID=1220924 RepID=W2SGZ7_CYPE1|nr:uncharacterized protein HMPREF1541_01340 [Cyphellophora europaea CBS 101466]ETN47149.1 hypothetical protein HMPREF1541_01340 [Cyphellophora europaea CBS 101466]